MAATPEEKMGGVSLAACPWNDDEMTKTFCGYHERRETARRKFLLHRPVFG